MPEQATVRDNNQSHTSGLPLPFFGAISVTLKSVDLAPGSAVAKPSAARPRFSSSLTADARLGIRLLYRKSSTKTNSAG